MRFGEKEGLGLGLVFWFPVGLRNLGGFLFFSLSLSLKKNLRVRKVRWVALGGFAHARMCCCMLVFPLLLSMLDWKGCTSLRLFFM